jgi:hypothetical protein
MTLKAGNKTGRTRSLGSNVFPPPPPSLSVLLVPLPLL